MNRNRSDQFEHLLITKFNLRFSTWGKFKNSSSFGSDAWMEHRFELFDLFCFPSIRNQTNPNFRWLILMDRQTKAKHRQSMQDYLKQFANIELLFTTGDDLFRDLRGYLDQTVERDYLITTRIDNDDAYRADVIDVVQSYFKGQDFEFLNFPKGYQYFTGNHRLYLGNDLSSPFMTLVERKTDTFKTALFEQHNLVRGKWPLQQMGGGRFWLQVIHDRNVANALCFGPWGSLRYYLSVIKSPERLPAFFSSVFRRRSTLATFGVRSLAPSAIFNHEYQASS